MPRGYAPSRVDSNQGEIVKVFRQLGASVAITSTLGKGFPDLVVGLRGCFNLLVELKDGSKPPSARKLSEAEQEFHQNWKGQIAIVSTMEEAVQLINSIK